MIPFFYYNKNRSIYGDQFFIRDLFKEEFIECENLDNLDGAVIMVRNVDGVEGINEIIQHLRWCILIVTGNEDGKWKSNIIKHNNCIIWLQTPKEKDKGAFFIPLGYPSKIEYRNNNRIYDWFFAGQITHNRRAECFNELKKLKNGFLFGTQGFGQGMKHSEYLDEMSKSKIVVCPSGPLTPDTFRLYEALELGCIPIIDNVAGNGECFGYWDRVFPNNPLPNISKWEDLEKTIENVLNNYEYLQKEVYNWWNSYKKGLVATLLIQCPNNIL